VKIEAVADVDDPRLDEYREIRDTARPDRRGLFVVESTLVVQRLLTRSHFRPRSVLATRTAIAHLADALASAPADLAVYVGSHALLHGVVGFKYHRGCLALAERGPALAAETVFAPAGRRLLLALEDLSDPDNVGAVFRNAQAFGADGVLLSPGTADPLYAKAVRVSVGAALTVPFARLEAWPAGLATLRRSGYQLLALSPRGDVEAADLGERPAPGRLVVIVGQEGAGLPPPTVAAADLTVRVAMAPGVDSLNVAAATAVVLHQLSRRRR
jgi:tRNA G18 (ribose-2'-O)-methylase SpoU